MFRIHREGHRIIMISCLCIFVVGLLLLEVSQPFRSLGAVLLLILLFLIVYFFRIPVRGIQRRAEHQIISPADGKVVAIEEVEDQEVLKQRCTQVSIFMSPLNVHINWFPCSGEVTYQQHHHGKYLVAWHPKSSTENERSTTVVSKDNYQILIRQIAGALARRIINYARVGRVAKQGDELGFIRFGSRVDLLLPPGCGIEVSIGQKVTGGQTVIAQLPLPAGN